MKLLHIIPVIALVHLPALAIPLPGVQVARSAENDPWGRLAEIPPRGNDPWGRDVSPDNTHVTRKKRRSLPTESLVNRLDMTRNVHATGEDTTDDSHISRDQHATRGDAHATREADMHATRDQHASRDQHATRGDAHATRDYHATEAEDNTDDNHITRDNSMPRYNHASRDQHATRGDAHATREADMHATRDYHATEVEDTTDDNHVMRDNSMPRDNHATREADMHATRDMHATEVEDTTDDNHATRDSHIPLFLDRYMSRDNQVSRDNSAP